MGDFVQFKTNQTEFNAFLKQAFKVTGDLKIPLKSISRDFYKSERTIFNLKGPGGYQDIKPATKTQKSRSVGFIYPILKRSGRLARSVLSPSGPDSVNKLSKLSLTIGTSTPYARVLQEGSSKMPARPFLFIDGGERRGSPNSRLFTGRRGRWTNIVGSYILAVYQSRGWTS